jgi:hypothetical protein
MVPRPLIVVLAAMVLVGAGMLSLGFLLPGRDEAAQCRAQCGFRHYRLVPDPAWGSNRVNKEPARMKCECY